MANNNEFNGKEPFRMRPIFIVANLLIAIFLAILISSFDNMSVRGGGFSVYAGPSDGAGEQFDENGELIQGGSSVILVATNTPEPTSELSFTPSVESDATVVTPESETGETDSILPAITATTSIVCAPPPTNWYEYVIKRGDRLGDIAIRSGTSVDALQQANCLPSTSINFGRVILVPTELVDVITPFAFACEQAPAGWLPYTVQPGDNVFRISIGSGISREELVKFNCLPSESVLVAGQIIYLPSNSTYLNGLGVEVNPTETSAPVATAVPSQVAATAVPTDTPQPTATETVAPVPTEEPERPEETPTLVTPERPQETPTPTEEATTVPTNIPPTDIPTEAPTLEATVEATVEATPIPADTVTPIPTEVPTEIPTALPTDIPTAVPTVTVAPTAIIIPTEILVPTEPVIPVETPTTVPTTEPEPTTEPTTEPTEEAPPET